MESIKHAPKRAKELRELADIVERGEVVALVWGFQLAPIGEHVDQFSMTLQEGDADAVRGMIQRLTAQVDKVPLKIEPPDGMGAVAGRAGEDGEGDYDAMEMYRIWRGVLDMVSVMAGMMGMSVDDAFKMMKDAQGE